MTDMVIPPEALKAAAKALNEAVCICLTGDNFAKSRVALEAALPHLRPMLELASKLGAELGRREALAQIYEATSYAEEWQLDDPRVSYVDVQIDKDTYRQLLAARETKEGK